MSTRIIRGIAGLALAVGIGVLWTPSPANANMRMELYDNTTGVGTVLTDIGNTGALTFNGTLGAFTVNVTTGTSAPPLGLPASTLAVLDLNSVNVASATGGTLTILLENSGYSGTGTLTDTSNIGGTQHVGGSMTATSAVYGNNIVPTLPADGSTTTAPPPLGGTPVFSLSSSSTSFSGSGSADFTTAGNFGLAKEVVVTVAPNGTISFDFSNDVSAVPEPATVAMALTGLPFLAVVALRRMKKNRA